MTKPVIVNRVTKGSPLTTAEHDANFTNLQNATVGLRAGSAGTTVTADLNGVITLVAGSGVTLTGDNTAKTITVDAASGSLSGNDITIGSNSGADTVLRSELNSLTIRSGRSDVAGVDEVAKLVLTPTGTIRLEVTGSPSRIDLNSKLVKLGPMTDEAATYPTMLQLGVNAGTGAFDVTAANGMLYYDTLINSIRFYNGSTWQQVLTGESGTVFDVGAFTTAQRDAISPSPDSGAIIWNSDTESLQVKRGTSWRNVIIDGILNDTTINTKGWNIGNSANPLNYTSTVHGDYALFVNAGGAFTGKLTLTADPVEINGRLRLKTYTTSQRDALASPQRGDMVYNTTLEKFQGYTNLGWVDLH